MRGPTETLDPGTARVPGTGRRSRLALLGVWGCAALLGLASGCEGEIDLGAAGQGGRRGELSPAPAGLRTLTPAQYEASVRGVLGLGPADAPIARLGQWATSEGAARGGLSPQTIESYEAAARDAAAYMFADPARRDAWLGCTPMAVEGDPCVEAFIARVGRRAFRRPLDADERARWTGLAVALGASEGSAHRGLELALSGLLQSPHFLYRVELTEPAPDPAFVDGRARYVDHALATRLSFMIWGESPDEALLDLADRGVLTSDDAVYAQVVDDMLDDPRADVGLERLLSELLAVDGLDALEKDAEVLPGFAALRAPLRASLLRTARAGIEAGGFPGMFRTRAIFATPATAALFGLDPASVPADGADAGPIEGRVGVLTNPAFLAMHAYPGKTSPAIRGLTVRRTFLCQDIPPPPVGVSTVLPSDVDGRLVTARELVAAHQREPACAACHERIDPIGLGLEHFDAVGVFRSTENGLPIDASGALDGVPFDDAASLSEAVAAHPTLMPCMASRVMGYGLGLTVPATHRDALVLAHGRSHPREILRALATSSAFRFAWPTSTDEAPPLGDSP